MLLKSVQKFAACNLGFKPTGSDKVLSAPSTQLCDREDDPVYTQQHIQQMFRLDLYTPVCCSSFEYEK